MFALHFFLTPVQAQTSDVTSSIAGTVRDPSGTAVAGASVESVAGDTGLTRTVQTRPDGSFTLPLLNIGQYKLIVDAASFERFQQNGIDLRLGYAAPVTITLQAGSNSETITVNAKTIVYGFDPNSLPIF